MKGLNIVFAGTPEFGLPCLDALYSSSHRVLAVYTQPDRPAGRGRKVQASAVKLWAEAHGIPVFQPLNFKDQSTLDELQALHADIMVVIAYGLILPRVVLNTPRLGCINVHASLLPRWRGASPIQQALLHGDAQSGVTIMQMDVGMDTGNILSTISCSILPHETATDLHDKLASLSPLPLLQTLDALQRGETSPIVQDEQGVTYAKKIDKEAARIDWSLSAASIEQLIRAFNPWPVAHTYLNDELLRIYHASVLPMASSAKPGTILSIDREGMRVCTGSSLLCIEKLQFAGGKMMSVSDWLNGGRALAMCHQVLQ